MIPLRDSMVDVQSPQQALRAYSSAKEYAYGILCDARHGESNGLDRGLIPPCKGGASPGPEPPQGQLRDGSASEPLASHTRYRSTPPTPGRDESHLGHNPISTHGNSGMPHSAASVRFGVPRSATNGSSGGRSRRSPTVPPGAAVPPRVPPRRPPRRGPDRPAPRPVSDEGARRTPM